MGNPFDKHDYLSEFNLMMDVWDDEWTESKSVCPKCKDVKMWQTGWYDGTLDDGGACIGTKYKCGKCGHYESC